MCARAPKAVPHTDTNTEGPDKRGHTLLQAAPFLSIQMPGDLLCEPLGAMLPDRMDSISIQKVAQQMTGYRSRCSRALSGSRAAPNTQFTDL